MGKLVEGICFCKLNENKILDNGLVLNNDENYGNKINENVVGGEE